MHIPLSKRLQACCRYIKTGDRVADVGCDHGYLGIHLLTSKIASSVYAADVNEMPLQSASCRIAADLDFRAEERVCRLPGQEQGSGLQL